MPLASGDIVHDRYRLEKPLGQGGMGAVWAAKHVVTGKSVALKFLTEEVSDESSKRRLVREARAACSVSHPHVVQVHDVLETESGLPVLVMDLLRGESLGARLEREPTVPADELLRIVQQVVSALEAAHARGVVHRDIKPDNVFLVQRDDGVLDVKVLDFGIAKVTKLEDGGHAETAKLTGTGAMVGTPYYMAPEQVFGEKDVDARTDLWSVGVLMYECLAGVRPTEGANLGQILKLVTVGPFKPLSEAAPSVPAPLARVVESCLERDRAKRVQSATALRDSLERVMAGTTLDGTEVTEAPPREAPKRARPWLAAVAAVTVLALGGGATAWTLRVRAPMPAAAAAPPPAIVETSTSTPTPTPAAALQPLARPSASAETPTSTSPPTSTSTSTSPPKSRPAHRAPSPSPAASSNGRGPGGVVMTPAF